jgi:hypothetical protein
MDPIHLSCIVLNSFIMVFHQINFRILDVLGFPSHKQGLGEGEKNV